MTPRSALARLAHVATGLLVLVVLAGAAPASAISHQTAGHAAVRSADGPVIRPVILPAGRLPNCASARPRLALYAHRGIDQVVCMNFTSRPTAVNIPGLCQQGVQIVFRFFDCFYPPQWTDFLINSSGMLKGTINGYTIFWNELSYKSRRWGEHIEVRITGATGKGSETTFTAPLNCTDRTPADCQATGRGHWKGQNGFLPAGRRRTFTGELGWESRRSPDTTDMSFSVDMGFDTPGFSPGGFQVGPTTDIRCDSASYFRPTKGGCVYPVYKTNLFILSTKDHKVKESADFIKDAQKAISNHAGLLGHKALTRATNGSLVRRNRRTACRHVRTKKGQSCDEYPFASTYEGASRVPRSDWKSQAINASQNSNAGRMLGTFLLQSRIMDGDPYYVFIGS